MTYLNNQGRTVTVNAERYRRMITGNFWDHIEDIHVVDMEFQQDYIKAKGNYFKK